MKSTIHPKPTDMARATYPSTITPARLDGFAAGVSAERVRLAADYLARSREAADRARDLRGSTLPDADELYGLAMGEAQTLTALALELVK